MKKRIFAILLVLSMLLSSVVLPAWAVAEEVVTPAADTCPCGCGELLADITWQPWTGEPKEGHFYLAGNFTQTEQKTVLSDNNVVLDLRGYTMSGEDVFRLFLVNGYLTVLDTVGGGKLMGKAPADETGGVVLVEENEMLGPVFTLASGILTQDAGSKASGSGGVVGVGKNATFRMTGGMILDGHTASTYGGGNVGSTAATSNIEILGGIIAGGTATKAGGNLYSYGKIKLENCKILGGTAGTWGGNIHVVSTTAHLTANNCVIANGVSNGTVSATANKYGGGNISLYSQGSATVTNCEIYGGYAATAGGNICVGRTNSSVTTLFKSCNIYGGSCGELGENVFGAISTSKATFESCTIDGGFHHGNSKLTLKGAMKIGGSGLRVGTGTLTATGLTAGAEILVTGNGTISGNTSYFKPSYRATITGTTSLTVATGTEGYCPDCGKNVTWAPYGTEGADHTYLAEDMSAFAETAVSGHYVLDLSGKHITAPGRAFSVAAGADLVIFDSVGMASVTGSNILANAGTLKLYGGKYIFAKGSAAPTEGGIVYNSGNLTIAGSFLDAAAYENAACNGGAISNADASGVTMTINGIKIIGGKANYGGGLHVGDYNNATITGGLFVDGKAAYGGNIAAIASEAGKKGNLTVFGIRTDDGEATSMTGNLYIARYDAAIADSYICNGSSTSSAGNVSIGLSTDVTYTDCIITGGSATKNGGNIYGGGRTTNAKFVDCLILKGKTASNGGNVSCTNGTINIVGGMVLFGEAAGVAGNLYAASSSGKGMSLLANTAGSAPLVASGKAATGGNIYASGILDAKAARIHNGYAGKGQDLHLASGAAVTLDTGVEGTLHINGEKSMLTSAVYGGAISGVTCNTASAAFLMDGAYGNCGIVVRDGVMYVATTAVVDSKGNATWYMSNEAAVAACGQGSYLKLFTANDLVLTKDLFVDLNGKAVAVSGGYAFYGMDASGDGFTAPSGSATGTTAASYDIVDAPNGNRYFVLVEDGKATYHRLDMRITGVTIRPSVDGIYYTAKWSCDDTVQALVDTYGVVASTEDMPDSGFTQDAGNLWTTFEKASFQSGVQQNGAVISGILKNDGRTAKENNANGKQAIFAKAYILFDNGSAAVSNDRIGLSLYEIMKNLDRLILEKPIVYRKYNRMARDFFEKWRGNGVDGWDLTKIPDPGDDGVINVLMIGNSYNVYFMEELDALAKAADVKMNVCSVYYSGCPFEKHYNWWIAGESHYQYYEMRDGVKTVPGKDVSLEWCLAQREWDVITFGMGGTNMRTLTAEQCIEKTRPYRTPLYAYMKESFPNAELYFHQTWSFDLGYVKTYTSSEFRIDTVEQQMAYTDKVRQVANAICAEDGVGRINTGDAWEQYRLACNAAGIEHCLTARLGVSDGTNPHAGDKSHDGDIGGGQYLNACTWFEVITGLDCRDTSYIPTYTYSGTQYPMSETMAQMLREAAHKAVTEMLPAYAENN